MVRIKLRLTHNPYKPETSLVHLLDGREEVCGETSFLAPVFPGGFYQWLEPHDTWPGFFAAAAKAFNANAFSITFAGTVKDRQLLEKSAKYWENRLELSVELRYVSQFKHDYYREFLNFYFRILDGTLSEFQEPQIRDAFIKLLNNQVEICITAPISSGKSTLLNALIGRKLLPTSVLAKTAVPTQVFIHPDNKDCTLTSQRNDKQWKSWNEPITGALLEQLNDETDPSDPSGKKTLWKKIHLESPIYRCAEERCCFLQENPMEVVFTDTPGNNNAWNLQHENTTAHVLNAGTWELILFIFSAETFEQTDTFTALEQILQRVKARGNWEHNQNRLLFVCNQTDKLSVSYAQVQHKLRTILQSFGIRDPQIYLTSAYAAELIRSERYAQNPDADPADWLTREQLDTLEAFVKELSSNPKESGPYRLHTHTSNPDKALYHFSSLPKYIQAELDDTVTQIQEESPEQAVWPEAALLHSGVPALEYAIWDHCNRLAFPMKLWQFQETMLPLLPDILQRTERRLKDILPAIEKVEREICEIVRQLQASEKVIQWIDHLLNQSEEEFVFDGELLVYTLETQLEERVRPRLALAQSLPLRVQMDLLSGWIQSYLRSFVYPFVDRLIRQMEEKTDYANSLSELRWLTEPAMNRLVLQDAPRFYTSVSRRQLMDEFFHRLTAHSGRLSATELIEDTRDIVNKAVKQQERISQDQYRQLQSILLTHKDYVKELQAALTKEYHLHIQEAEDLKKQRECIVRELEITDKLFAAIQEIRTDPGV